MSTIRFKPLLTLLVVATALMLGCSGRLLDRDRNVANVLGVDQAEVSPSSWFELSSGRATLVRKVRQSVNEPTSEAAPSDSTTEASDPEASATEASDPEASATEASATEASDPEASATEASATEASATEASATEAVVTEESTTEAAARNETTTSTTTAAPETTSSTNAAEETTTSTTTTAAPTTRSAADDYDVDFEPDTNYDDEQPAETMTSTTTTTTLSPPTTVVTMVRPTAALHSRSFNVRCNQTFCTVSVGQSYNLYTLMNSSEARDILGHQIRRAIVNSEPLHCEPVDRYAPPILSTTRVEYVSAEPHTMGAYAAEQQFPWHALITFDNYPDSTCGGALISQSVVLLPAACFWRSRIGHEPMRYSNLTVMLGATTSTAKGALVFSLNHWDELYHPQFDPRDIYLKNNIGAIKLPKRVFLSSAINIIDLGIHPTPGAVLQVIGYGRNAHFGTRMHLRYHGVQLTTQAACIRAYGELVCRDDVSTVVGTHLNTNATLCQVEPGAALIEYQPASWFVAPNVRLYGLAAFVGQTGICKIQHSEPEGFVRLIPHIEWIRKAVRAAENIINGVFSEDNYQR